MRNEIIHHKPAPDMDVSVNFLRRYLDELVGIKMNHGMDVAKGKGYLSFDHTREVREIQSVGRVCKWQPPDEG